MDFKHFFFGIFASFFMVVQRVILLIIYPYRTMRKISSESDMIQIAIIFAGVFCYFYFGNSLREYQYEPFVLFLMTVFHYFLTILFFFGISSVFKKDAQFTLKPFALTLAYALIPTLIWFSANSLFFALIPPPRTLSTLGKAFSIFYISFSVALLCWKIILEYLAIRFASKLPLYRILYMLLIYIAIVVPYAMTLYVMKFFRIPFI